MGEHLEEGHYERVRKALGPKVQFIQGDVAYAYGALLAGCTYFAGYPITPATETAEAMSRLMPRVGGVSIQMEDEIASIGAIIGASWAGAKAMTATSGPGFSLMMENLGYACMVEAPMVLVNVQRSGPSTGQPTEASQGDVMQARWGTHGDHEMLALAPSTVQECLELTVDCFNLAERYRNPAVLLMDGEMGHLRERIVMPHAKDLEVVERRHGEPGDLVFGGELVPPMIEFGRDQFVHVTGSTHKEDGMRDVSSQSVHDRLVRRLVEKIEKDRDALERVEERFMDDAEVAVLSYGASARPGLGAVIQAREEGMRVGFMRLISIWPFPQRTVRELGRRVERIYVPEMNLGQVNREVERFADCEVVPVSKIGGVPHNISEILKVIKGGDAR